MEKELPPAVMVRSRIEAEISAALQPSKSAAIFNEALLVGPAQ